MATDFTEETAADAVIESFAPGTDPRFVSMISELVRERLTGAAPLVLGGSGAGHDVCPDGCCSRGAALPASAAAMRGTHR